MNTDAATTTLTVALKGRYAVHGVLTQGRLGPLYIGEDLRLGRRVAIKVLSIAPGSDRAVRAAFLACARRAAGLSHPNIIQVLQVEEAGDFAVAIMALVTGESLGERIQKTAVTPDDVARWLQQAASAVSYAHSRGIAHGALHPGNVMLETETGRVIVTDFGIGAIGRAGDPHTDLAHDAEETAQAADIVALGQLGQWMLEGIPRAGNARLKGSNTGVGMSVTTRDPIPARLAAALARCASTDSSVRFATAAALAESLAAPVETETRVPAAIRAWIKAGQSVDPVLIGALAAVTPAYLTVRAAGLDASVATGLAIAIPLAVSGVHRLARIRRLLSEGFTVADLREGIRMRVREEGHEIGSSRPQEPPAAAQVLRMVAGTAGATALVAGVGAVVFRLNGFGTKMLILADQPGVTLAWWQVLVIMLPMIVPPATVLAVVTAAGAELSHRRNPFKGLQAYFARLRLRLWESRFGDIVTRLLSRGLTRHSTPGMLRDHPTEVALGIAAGELFDALPPEAKREVGDVPSVVQRLETDARALRERVTEIDKALAMSSRTAWRSSDAEAPDARIDEVARTAESRAAALSRLREDARNQLRATVGALERIRLDLLRLGAGAGSLAQLTGNLRTASEVIRAHTTFTAALTDALAQHPSNP